MNFISISITLHFTMLDLIVYLRNQLKRRTIFKPIIFLPLQARGIFPWGYNREKDLEPLFRFDVLLKSILLPCWDWQFLQGLKLFLRFLAYYSYAMFDQNFDFTFLTKQLYWFILRTLIPRHSSLKWNFLTKYFIGTLMNWESNIYGFLS